MPEPTIISIPKTMPLTERISEVNRQLSEWLNSLDKGFDCGRDVLRLTRYEQNASKYSYHYIIDRGVSCFSANKSRLTLQKSVD